MRSFTRLPIRRSFLSTLLALTSLPLTTSIPNCPLAGPEFPAPKHLAGHPTWQKAMANLTAVFDKLDYENALQEADKISYSLQVFSTNAGPPILWERHHTSSLLDPYTQGVRNVDADTVYRIGSLSKVYTVLAFLVAAGDIYWTSPITFFIPELAAYDNDTSEGQNGFDAVKNTAWEDITIGALASQVSGIGRDYGVLGELTETVGGPLPFEIGLPTLSEDQVPPCGTWPLCTRAEFFAGLQLMYPSYPPWESPTYSNIAYQLLSYALENITGRAFADILHADVIKPLNLQRTYYDSAPSEVGIIPGKWNDAYWWNVRLGDANPGGNMYASSNDLSTLGRAILNSSLLKSSLTRRWLNPVEFTSDYAASIGSPWGIRRIQLDKKEQPFRMLDVFIKAGEFGKYRSFITLLKDFQLGFTIQTAGDSDVTPSPFQVADVIGETVIPAYDAIAREEANRVYAGTYISHDELIVITTDPGKPGLGIGPWISNGTDMVLESLKLVAGPDADPNIWPKVKAEARLYYTQLESSAVGGGFRQSWKAVYEDTHGKTEGTQMFSSTCGSWVGVTAITYGSLSLDAFVFNFDTYGKVVSIENLALRTKLYKI